MTCQKIEGQDEESCEVWDEDVTWDKKVTWDEEVTWDKDVT